jgi:CubicO group peptidase (beta-lactamase class C family)
MDPKELISSIGRAPLDFTPGENRRHGDADYYLLGYLLEKLSGLTYGQFLRSGVFGPLGMTNTAVYDWTAVVDHAASGYVYDEGVFKKAFSRNTAWPGHGILRSTARDLHIWTQALSQGDLLKKSTLKAALTPIRLSDGKKPPNSPGYGYGWFVKQLRGLDLVENGGGADGFQSRVAYYPEQALTVLVLINASAPPPGLDAAALALRIGQLFLYDQMDARKPAAIEP